MSLVHELEELVDNGLQEFPVRFEKSRILTNDIHYIAGNDGFVVLAPYHLGKSK
jgi:hypothetical protein